MCVTALLGLEYPDPMGSGLSVPVLGSQVDPLTGSTVPLAGTMEDPNGKGLISRETNEVDWIEVEIYRGFQRAQIMSLVDGL